jgi:hypothetical protein
MATQTVSQIENELAKLEQELEAKRQILEEQKQAEVLEIKAKREKGIKDAWEKVTQELVKANLITPPAFDNITTESGKKRSETTFHKKCFEQLGEILGIIDRAPASGVKNKRLNDSQKAKIEDWLKEGMSVADMNKKLTTNPTSASYQRINNYVKKLQKG